MSLLQKDEIISYSLATVNIQYVSGNAIPIEWTMQHIYEKGKQNCVLFTFILPISKKFKPSYNAIC
jgi:hypothetical protein